MSFKALNPRKSKKMTKSVPPTPCHNNPALDAQPLIEPAKNDLSPPFAVLSYLLDRTNSIHNEDERSKATDELFRYINKHSKILINDPSFRQCVREKIVQLEMYVRQRRVNYSKARYPEALDILKKSMTAHIRHNSIRKEMLSKIDHMSGLLIEYQSWMREDSLIKTMRETMRIIDEIEGNPKCID